jgi:hypothetical protein
MEVEMLYNSKSSEVSYLKKYLDDLERENELIKRRYNEQIKNLNIEK